MAAGVVALLVVAGGASYYIGVSNAGTTTSTATSTFTQQAQTITQSITQTLTLTNTQTSTSTFTTTASPIRFAFVPQPKTGPASNFSRLFNAPVPASAKVRFLNFNTTDGVGLSGALVEPQNTASYAVLALHGRGANYTAMINKFSVKFVSYGYAFLAINTRGHDANAYKDDFDDYAKDVGAGMTILKSLSYSNVILLGHSFGNVQAIAYAANLRDPAVKAVLAIEPPANLPEKTLNASITIVKDPALYGRLYSEAKSLIAQGKPTAILPEQVQTQYTGGRVNVSAINFMTNLSPESTAVSDVNIRRVAVPTLIIRVSSDVLVPDSEARWLLGNATAPGSQVPSVQYTIVPDPTGKAGHAIAVVAVQQAVSDTLYSWLQGQKIGP